MPFKTFVAGTEGLASDVNTYLMKQAVMQFATATDRNTALPTPTEGMCVFLTTPDHFQIWSNNDWITHDVKWNTYTPTYTNFTLGNGTVTAKYYQTGKMVTHFVFITLGTTSTVTGNITYSLPISASSTNRYNGIARATIGATSYPCTPLPLTAGTAAIYAHVTSAAYASLNATSATIPATWASGSIISIQATYEVV